MIQEIISFFLYYFYFFFNKEYDFFFLKNIYCKDKYIIKYDLIRKENIQKSYELYKSNNLLKNFKMNIKKNITKNGYIITENDFPYNLNNNVKHYIIWTNYDIFKIKKILNKRFNNYIFFRNLIENKSIKDIEHYHIFIEIT